MKTIPLTKGYEAIVDDEDYEFLMQWKWTAVIDRSGRVYATRHARKHEGNSSSRRMHRVICATRDGMETDHKNGNTLDNRRDNLREATRIQNMRNRALHKNNTSGHKGVGWHSKIGKWQARISVNKRRINLGFFIEKEDAAAAYMSRAAIEFGEFNRRQET